VDQAPFSVVVVDDDDEVRAVVGARLRLSRRFDVVGEGATGADAIALATAHRPALMVLDASMPDMDGLEALPAILDASPATRVVMFSGFGGRALETAARALGAVDFIDKASPLRDLSDRLLRLLGVDPSADGSTAPPAAPDEPTLAGAPGPAPETALAEHLERFRTVFDQAAIGMATMTLAGTVVRINPALVRLTGEPEDRLIGRRYSDLTGSGADDALQDALARVTGGSHEVAEVEHRLTVGGGTAWIRSTLTVVRDPAGRPLYLFAQAEDVTAQRRVIEELRLSEERFRLLVESVVDYAIFMLDPGGFVTTWNAGAERMKGYRADEIIGQHFRVFYPPEMQALRHPEHELEIAVREGRYEEEGWRIRQDGTPFWASVVITALFDHDHHLVGFGKVTRDFTERRDAEAIRERAAAELAEANERLRIANEETGDFLAITAHELHSPVTAMTGAAELLAHHWDDLGAADRAENFQNLSRSARRTRRLLDELLMASRLEAGQLEVRVEPMELGPALAEAVAVAEQPVTVTGAAGGLIVRADRVRVVQILGNLLANAARYGEPPITVESRAVDRAVEVRVCDAGRGVPADLEPKLFRKFVRGAGRRDRGTGLGLFIVRELVRRQGGDAWYERGPDGRPCFCFTLPRAG